MNQYPLSSPSSASIIQKALAILRPHFPGCLPLYRRLQFGRFYTTSYLLTNLSLTTPQTLQPDEPFLIAFIDRAVRPETEVWLYASFESFPASHHEAHKVRELCREFARAVSGIDVAESIHGSRIGLEEGGGEKDGGYASHMTDSRIVLFGAVGEGVRDVWREMGVMSGEGKGDVQNHVFSWDLEVLERVDVGLEAGMRWGDVRREDLRIVRNRTTIPRQESTLAGLPSLGIYSDDGRILAWAFVGLDASLTTLHVEEEFRGRGLAKKLTAKLFREKMDRFWEEGVPRIAHGNVIYGNEASVAMCKSLGGRDVGKCYWMRERLLTG